MLRKAGMLMMAIAVMAMTGCSKSTNTTATGLTPDQANVLLSVTAAPEVVSDGTFDVTTPAGFSVSPGGVSRLSGIDGSGDPETNPGPQDHARQWRREITGRTVSFEYEFTARDSANRPTAVHVTVHKHFTGLFHILTPEFVPSSTGADSFVVMHDATKPLADHWVRHLWLVRMSPALNHGRAWRLVAASGVNVTSEVDGPGTQPVIQSIRVQSGVADSTFSDPAAAIHWRKLWNAAAGTPVTVTVTTNAPDDIVVLMHHDGRASLQANGDNTYTGTWVTPDMSGLKHFGINALSNGTLNDAESAYHSHAWLFPYVNRGEGYGEAAPTPF